MNTSLVITLLATDRPGLISELSEVLNHHHANWTESRFARLAGKFAGLLRVSIADEQIAMLREALLSMQNDELLVQVEKSDAPANDAEERETLVLEILGQDRPGIVEDISRQLTSLKVNVEKMQSEQRIASMSNEILFYAELTLRLPTAIEPEDVQETLEAMSDQFMVDLKFS